MMMMLSSCCIIMLLLLSPHIMARKRIHNAETRIIGGSDSQPKPYYVLLAFWRFGSYSQCGGTLIHSDVGESYTEHKLN